MIMYTLGPPADAHHRQLITILLRCCVCFPPFPPPPRPADFPLPAGFLFAFARLLPVLKLIFMSFGRTTLVLVTTFAPFFFCCCLPSGVPLCCRFSFGAVLFNFPPC